MLLGRSCRRFAPHGLRTFSFRAVPCATSEVGRRSISYVDSTERKITVDALGELYKDWKKTRKGYSRVDENGISVEIPYIRTSNSPSFPNVVAMHGSPGSYEDYMCFLQPLSDQFHVNFTAASLPDIEYSMKTGNFWHSTQEKTELQRRFLEDIKISNIDILICHSSGMFPALELALYAPNVNVKSIVFLAPFGTRRTQLMEPAWLHRTLLSGLKSPWSQSLVVGVYQMFVKIAGLKRMTPLAAIQSQYTMHTAQYWKHYKKWFADLKKKGIPYMMVYSDVDKLISPKHSLGALKALGNGDEKNFYVYKGRTPEEAKLTQKPYDKSLPDVVRFSEGGHYMFQKFPHLTCQHIAEFYNDKVVNAKK